MFWMTSDLHFGHENILKFCDRPFSSVEEMNEALIKKFNNKVSQLDTTFFLGDMFFCNVNTARDILSRMHGTKILIRGNHDLSPNLMYKIGFDAVLESARIKVGRSHIMLSHFPYRRQPWNHLWLRLTNPKYRHKLNFKKLEDQGLWLCHGHTHSKEQVKGRMIHVGVDAWNYEPVPITKISEIIDKAENEKK